MSFGGFLGIGDSYYPLPWKALNYDTSQGGYVVDLDKDRLQEAPSYTGERGPDLETRATAAGSTTTTAWRPTGTRADRLSRPGFTSAERSGAGWSARPSRPGATMSGPLPRDAARLVARSLAAGRDT